MLKLIEELSDRGKHGDKLAAYLCECGNTRVRIISVVKYGRSTHCGCKTSGPKKHNMSKSPEYRSWKSMKDRCYRKKNRAYHNYGGRGITVCDRWMDKEKGFENFYEDMGPRPSKDHSIDRINNDRNYDKQNCRWATQKQQANNKGNNRIIEFDGIKYTVSEFSELHDMSHSVVLDRLDSNWSIEEIINTPVQQKIRRFEYKGRQYTINELSEMFSISLNTLKYRIAKGIPIEEAIIPPKSRNKND